MREVIADTSPIQYLHQTGLLDLLPTLYSQVLVPQAVVDELRQGLLQGVELPDIERLPWLIVRQVPSDLLVPSLPNLGIGELEALSLARSLPDSTVILDDAFARQYARELDLRMTGTLGILLKAKHDGILDAIAPILDQLDTLKFRLASSTRSAVLRLAGELGQDG